MITIRIEAEDGALRIEQAPPAGIYRPPAWLAALSVSFTHREIEIIRHTAAGMTHREVGLKLGISEKTVRSHIGKNFAKLGIENSTTLTAWAWGSGMRTPDDIVETWRVTAPHLVELA